MGGEEGGGMKFTHAVCHKGTKEPFFFWDNKEEVVYSRNPPHNRVCAMSEDWFKSQIEGRGDFSVLKLNVQLENK